MLNAYKKWLVLAALTSSLLACLDHRLGGTLSPTRLRLKTTSNGTTTTTYSYDVQNQPLSITRNQVVATIQYGDPQRQYTTSDSGANHIFYLLPTSAQPNGEIVVYPPQLNNTTFRATRYARSANGQIIYSPPLQTLTYSFEPTGRLSSYAEYRVAGSNIDTYSYTYSGENISLERVITASGRGANFTYAHAYDNKTNPFYGLWDPELDPRLRFSRNNILTTQSRGLSSPEVTLVYSYDYNPQGLPIKRTTTTNGVAGEVLSFTYESY